ncbi:unnamed protein product [Fusarium fujikuroi]|uniref:Uncharacterized protein n=1 Tax=Fusarium fujikuroi TaxID=5127 RepID=A0A9Q9U757_FUSFU|nr:unnamed protein product [Fusarium fujikuroi]VTT66899.1 unnamed protein product [Fusarium fujikuroi]VZH91010.1 unnamed protein product [Fusarium fujikuroi]
MYGYRINAFEALAEPGEAQKVMTVSFAAVGDDLYEDESACLPSSARYAQHLSKRIEDLALIGIIEVITDVPECSCKILGECLIQSSKLAWRICIDNSRRVSAPISPELGTSHHERLSGAAGSRAQVQVAVGSGEMESP